MTKLELALEIVRLGYGPLSPIREEAQTVILNELRKKSK